MTVDLGLSTCTPSGDTLSRGVRTELTSGFPDGELGYDLGVSGYYTGELDDFLVMAGGCNFLDKLLSEKGGKHYYRGIYIARVSGSSVLYWVKVGSLPVEAAYGVTVSLPDRLIFIGRSDSSGRLPSVLSFSFDCMEKLGMACEILPSFPCTFDNMSATLLGGTLYVLGGYRNGIPFCFMFSFCLSNYSGGWTEIFFPGKSRVRPVYTSLFGSLYTWGGFIPGKESSILTGGLCYQLASGQWQVPRAPLATEGQPLTLTDGASVSYRDTLIMCAGGVNRDIFEDAISGRYKRACKSEYLLQPVEWYHFNDQPLAYDVWLGEWIWTDTPSPMLARAGASLVLFGEALFYIGGELKPGVRTSDICHISFRG